MKNSNNKTVKKGDLPTKQCLYCNRPFSWRKSGQMIGNRLCIVVTLVKSKNLPQK